MPWASRLPHTAGSTPPAPSSRQNELFLQLWQNSCLAQQWDSGGSCVHESYTVSLVTCQSLGYFSILEHVFLGVNGEELYSFCCSLMIFSYIFENCRKLFSVFKTTQHNRYITVKATRKVQPFVKVGKAK